MYIFQMEQVFDNVNEYMEKAEFDKEYYVGEIQVLTDTIDELHTEMEDMNDIVDRTIARSRELEEEKKELVKRVQELILDGQDARRTHTALEVTVSVLVFVYGMIYGAYFAKCT